MALSFILGLNVVAHADDTAMPVIQFAIKPRLCVLSEGETRCQDLLEITWTSPVARSLCLYRNDQSQPLRCWQRRQRGEHRVEISVSRNVEFQLRALAQNDPVAREAFEVVHDNTKYRRRRRNAWSFF